MDIQREVQVNKPISDFNKFLHKICNYKSIMRELKLSILDDTRNIEFTTHNNLIPIYDPTSYDIRLTDVIIVSNTLSLDFEHINNEIWINKITMEGRMLDTKKANLIKDLLIEERITLDIKAISYPDNRVKNLSANIVPTIFYFD